MSGQTRERRYSILRFEPRAAEAHLSPHRRRNCCAAQRIDPLMQSNPDEYVWKSSQMSGAEEY